MMTMLAQLKEGGRGGALTARTEPIYQPASNIIPLSRVIVLIIFSTRVRFSSSPSSYSPSSCPLFFHYVLVKFMCLQLVVTVVFFCVCVWFLRLCYGRTPPPIGGPDRPRKFLFVSLSPSSAQLSCGLGWSKYEQKEGKKSGLTTRNTFRMINLFWEKKKEKKRMKTLMGRS